MDNKEIILKEFRDMKGQFVITDTWKVERLIAIVEDEMDYYYMTYDGRKSKLYTCVGSIIKLKNKIEDKNYQNFIRLARLNHFDQIDIGSSENIEYKKSIETLVLPNKLLTEVYWDLN